MVNILIIGQIHVPFFIGSAPRALEGTHGFKKDFVTGVTKIDSDVPSWP